MKIWEKVKDTVAKTSKAVDHIKIPLTNIVRTTLDITHDFAKAFVTSPELVIAYSTALAEMYMSDQTLPAAYWDAVERGDDALAIMRSHILNKFVEIMVRRISQGVTIRYFRTRHLEDIQMLGDVGVELLRTWFDQRLQERFNRQGYDEQGHIPTSTSSKKLK